MEKPSQLMMWDIKLRTKGVNDWECPNPDLNHEQTHSYQYDVKNPFYACAFPLKDCLTCILTMCYYGASWSRSG